MTRIDSLADLDAALPGFVVDTGHPQRDVADGIDRLLRQRFAYGYSTFSWRENWPLVLVDRIRGLFADPTAADVASGRWQPSRFSSPVAPDDILKYPVAMCTQQAMVQQAALARHGISYATVGFANPHGHMALAAKVDGEWRYYDSNHAPRPSSIPLRDLAMPEMLRDLYKGSRLAHGGVYYQAIADRGRIDVKWRDHYPAWRGAFLQRATSLFARFGWTMFLILAALLFSAWSRARSDADDRGTGR